MLQEFKDFINKGSVFEAAVGLVMALAFVPVVNSVIDGILMPIIAAIVGEPNFNTITIGIGQADIPIGSVITQIVSFVSVAAVVFLMVEAYNKMNPPEPADAGRAKPICSFKFATSSPSNRLSGSAVSADLIAPRGRPSCRPRCASRVEAYLAIRPSKRGV